MQQRKMDCCRLSQRLTAVFARATRSEKAFPVFPAARQSLLPKPGRPV
jgi:hypothetical protein